MEDMATEANLDGMTEFLQAKAQQRHFSEKLEVDRAQDWGRNWLNLSKHGFHATSLPKVSNIRVW